MWPSHALGPRAGLISELRARAAGSWPQSHGWGTGWAGNPALPGWLSRRAETRQLVTRGVAWPVTWAWGHPERQPRPPPPPGAPTPVLALHRPPPRPPGARGPPGKPFSGLAPGNSLSTCPRRPRWPPSVLPIPGVWGPWAACTARPPRPSLGSRDLGLGPCCSACLPSPCGWRPTLPRRREAPCGLGAGPGAAPGPRPQGSLHPSLAAQRRFPLPGPGPAAASRQRPQSRLRLPPPLAGLLGPRAPPTPRETPALRRAFCRGARGHPSCCLRYPTPDPRPDGSPRARAPGLPVRAPVTPPPAPRAVPRTRCQPSLCFQSYLQQPLGPTTAPRPQGAPGRVYIRFPLQGRWGGSVQESSAVGPSAPGPVTEGTWSHSCGVRGRALWLVGALGSLSPGGRPGMP